MVVTASPSAPSERAVDNRLLPLRVKVVLVTIVLALIGFISYGIGTDHGREAVAHVATGRAYVSPYQVGVRAGGWSYGFELTRGGMDWYDRRGMSHQGGIPPCLQHGPRFSPIRFGWSTAAGPHGDQWRVVTWVQCLAR